MIRPAAFRSALSALALALALAAPGAGVDAQMLQPDEDIVVTADRAVALSEERRTVWTGDVRVMQGAAVLTAPEVAAAFDENGAVLRIDAQGGVRYSNDGDVVEGETAEYDALERTLTVTGDVVAARDRQVVTGGRVVYHIDTGRIELTPKEGERVRGVFRLDSGESS